MKFNINIKNPRKFSPGNDITIKDYGTIKLESDEQVTFLTEENNEYDVCKKDCGFYATPSINGRLKDFGFKTALTKNTITGKIYIMLVENKKNKEFENYLKKEKMVVVKWLK